MRILKIIIFLSIAILYNIFIHYLANMMYKDLPYEEKFKKSNVFLLIAGILGIILSILVLKKNKKYKDSIISIGLGIGGSLLIIISIVSNWENISNAIKIWTSGLCLIGLIWVANKYIE